MRAEICERSRENLRLREKLSNAGGNMQNVWGWARNGLAIIGVLALGFWLGSGRTVKASSSDSGGIGVQFQLAGVNQASSLLVYQPETRTVYVYQGATTGNASVQCSYKFQMTRPGEVIHRVQCAVPQLNP
jgi:hypothetical protein